jgi:hypothetical protein
MILLKISDHRDLDKSNHKDWRMIINPFRDKQSRRLEE